MAGEIFISYRRADMAHAKRLHDLLKAEGVDAWYDAQVGAGQDWRATTAAALQKASTFILLYTRAAAASDDIAKELAAATFSKKLIVPVRLEDIQPEGAFLYELASRNWIDAFEDTDARLAELAKTLATLVSDGISAESVVGFERQARPARKRRLLRWPAWIAGSAAALLLLAAVVAAMTFLPLAGSGPPRQVIAFYGFAPLDDAPESVAIAANTTREVRDTLAAMRLETAAESDTHGTKPEKRIERANELKALYALSGEVRTEGNQTTVSILLEDIPSRATIWPESVSDPKTQTVSLPVRAAILATDTISCTIGLRASLKRDDPSTVAMLPGICRTVRQNPADTIQRFREFRKKAPDSPRAQSTFAVGSLLNIAKTPIESREALMREIDDAIDRSNQLSPNNPQYLLALYVRAMVKAEPYGEMERLAAEALKISPDDATLNTYYLNLLHSLGRLKEVTFYARAAVAGDPLSPAKQLAHAQNLAETGQPAEAARVFEQTMRRTPSAGVWAAWMRAALGLGAGDPDAIMGAPAAGVDPEVVSCWRAVRVGFANATGARRKEAITKVQACIDQRSLSSASAFIGFVALGENERAAALVTDRTSFLRNEGEVLYWPVAAPLRNSDRFIKLAQDLELIDYWRNSGHLPDFCATEKTAPVCDLIKAK